MRCAGFNLADELASIPPGEVGGLLADVATVGRYDATALNAYGGRTEQWTDDGTVACSVENEKPQQPTQVGNRLEDPAMSYKIKVAAGTLLNVKDHLTVNEVAYEIQGEVEKDTLGLFNLYWCQIVKDVT